MSNPVQALIQDIYLASTETDLRFKFMDGAGVLFHAQHWSIALRDDTGNVAQIDLKGLPDSFLDYYLQFGITIDPLRAYVLDHHASVHEQILFTEADWKRSDLYVHGCGRQYDHEHAMTGAIVGNASIIGWVNFARTSGTPAFDTQDLAYLNAVCTHLSVALARLRPVTPTQSQALHSYPPALLALLTPRELQIAELVAQGLSNSDIGARLWISHNTVKQALKRIFQKLQISTRTQLVAKLFR